MMLQSFGETPKLPPYQKISLEGPNTLPKNAALFTEEKYVLPSYALAKKSLKELVKFSAKKDLSEKELKKVNELKQNILDYQSWVQLTKLYQKSHYVTLLHRINSKDEISKQYSRLSIKASNDIRAFIKSIPHLTGQKDFVHPSKEAIKRTGGSKGKPLTDEQRQALYQKIISNEI